MPIKICLVVPCYNESGRLNIRNYSIFTQEENRFLLFVNDGSLDNTLSILTGFEQTNPEKIKVLSLIKNSGKAEAVRQGMLAALNWKEFDYIGFWDADLSTPLDEVALFQLKIAENPTCDLFIGSRFKRLGANISRSPVRHYLGRVFSTFVSVILNLPVYDSQCGAKIFRTAIVKTLFNAKFITTWLFDVELLSRLIIHYGHEKAINIIYEIPLNEWQEKEGSRVNPLYFLKAPFELLRIYFAYFVQMKK